MLKFLKFIPVQLTVFLVIGILIGNYYRLTPYTVTLILGVLLILLLVAHTYYNQFFSYPLAYTIIAFLLFIGIGISSITFQIQQNNSNYYAANTLFHTKDTLFCKVRITKVLKPTIYYNKYEAKVTQIDSLKATGTLLIHYKRDSCNKFEVSDCVLFKAVFKEVPKPLNPYAFDYKNYLEKQQIFHQVFIDNSKTLKCKPSKITLKGIAASFRKKVTTHLQQAGFKNNELALINTLLLGQRTTLSKELRQSYINAGAIHILAVSGLHVGILLLLFMFVLKPLHYFRHGKLVATILAVLLLWMYAILAGLSASVVRAVVMFTAVVIGTNMNRITNVYNTLFVSMFFLLLFNPFYLFEVGFQFSYLAVFSIVWLQPKLYNLHTFNFFIFDKGWQLLSVSIAAQLGVLPLSLYYFHQFPGLFFVSNLIIIPFLGIILGAGLLVIALSFFNLLPSFLVTMYSFMLAQMNHVVVWVSQQEAFLFKNIPFSFYDMIGIYALLLFLIKWIEKKNFHRFVWVLISVIAVQSVFIFERYQQHSVNSFIVFNQRKNTVIGNRNGSDLTVSTKQVKEAKKVLVPYLVETGVHLKFTSVKNVYAFKTKSILVVDSLGVYKLQKINPTIVILRQSPKIHLERLLNYLHPKLVVADASNYTFDIRRWKQTCLKKKTPFYSTNEKGALILE
ncbi:ComEC/Rec2 family competence protein [Lutibacter sp.]